MIASERALAIIAISQLLPTVESAMLANCHTVCVTLEPLNDLINATIALYGIGAPREHPRLPEDDPPLAPAPAPDPPGDRP